ncbi:hypothetical protein SNEBB_004386 [Seison nebaliae]|nr:hypothetical protein SNEBB_004386 [Seison nebaliae]
MDPSKYELPRCGSDIDYTKIGSIRQRRLNCYINSYNLTTLSLLNRFELESQKRLRLNERQLDGIERQLILLNDALDSVLTKEQLAQIGTSSLEKSSEDKSQNSETVEKEEIKPEEQVEEVADENEEVEEPIEEMSSNVKFEQYLKLVKIGVPPNALFNKMRLEGFTEEEIVEFTDICGK